LTIYNSSLGIIFIKKKIMEFFKKYSSVFTLVLLVLVLFRSCGTGSDVKRLKTQVEELNKKVVTQEQLIETIKTTPNWKTLEIEELSDKNRVPINFFKNKEEKN